MATIANSKEIIKISSGDSTKSINNPLHGLAVTTSIGEASSSAKKQKCLASNVHSLSSTVSSSCHDILNNFKQNCLSLPHVEEMDVIQLLNGCTKLEGLCTFIREIYYDQHYANGDTVPIVDAYERQLNKM